ncbi:hypothetical protein BDQ94DRAFT_124235 [Aspergillus welwitschiae]|uniref:Uncharacterized protein n=1 Tax=Aspergillus welwitschiae TaxID=1341132 RepID=A0A3F3Q919_9EURO|nr:hypothetical protein BDQ94DRAFT_124235 [Aspergillus welwitschiae]RDH35678.1 hypothetical protein BDQ94DRAFT_124235 [Aspergillus welwitschiae]
MARKTSIGTEFQLLGFTLSFLIYPFALGLFLNFGYVALVNWLLLDPYWVAW